MRVLFTTTHFPGNWHPLVPFAEALQTAGHDVAFATAPATCAAISTLGFRCFPAGADETAEEEHERRVQAAALPWKEFSAWAWVNLFTKSWATRALPDLLA